MAVRPFTKTLNDPSGRYQIGLIDTAAAAGNRLIDTDTTDTISVSGVKTIRASATYVKGSSTNGRLSIVVDGVTVANSATSTTDGDILTATFTGAVFGTITVLATITGTATGASLNLPRIGVSNPVTNS